MAGHYICDQKIAGLIPGGSSGGNFLLQCQLFVLILDHGCTYGYVSSPPFMFPQRHVKDPSDSARGAGGVADFSS